MMLPPRRLTALDLLAEEMGRGMSRAPSFNPEIQGIPPGLPDPVLRSILSQRSYGEGQVIPRPTWGDYEGFAPDRRLFLEGANQREQLPYELGMARQFPSYGQPLGEGQIAVPTDTERLRYSRPYNLGFGNLGALY